MFSIAHTQTCCILCLLVLQICCHSLAKYVPHWLPIRLILLSNDTQLYPGPLWQNDVNFMTCDVNSLKDNFQILNLIEAHNSISDYHLISINETSLNDSVELPETLQDDYTFVHANNTANTRLVGWDFSISILFLLLFEMIVF